MLFFNNHDFLLMNRAIRSRGAPKLPKMTKKTRKRVRSGLWASMFLYSCGGGVRASRGWYGIL